MWTICRHNVLNRTKLLLLGLHARDWLSLDAWLSKDGYYDRVSTR